MTDLARQYYQTGNIVWVTGIVFRLMIPAAILWTGLSTRIYDMSHKLARTGWYFTILFYLSLYTILTHLAFMPLAFYLGFMRQHAYGLSNQTVIVWLRKSSKVLSVATTDFLFSSVGSSLRSNSL